MPGNILWLASYPKSGNTWLRAFLHNLLVDLDEPVDINKLAALTLGDSQAKWYRAVDDRAPGSLSPQALALLRPQVHAQIAASFTNTVMVKTHNALVEVAGAPMITMAATAGAIYVVRNPLDVVLSYAHHLGISLDQAATIMETKGFETAATPETVPEHQSDWSSHVYSWTGMANPALLVLRYEDMTANPVKSFGAVAKFLGMKVTGQRLKRAIRFSSFKEMRNQEDKAGFVERTPAQDYFFRSGRAGGWRKQLTDDLVRRIVMRHREQMERFRYIPSGY